jgi:transcriptional regulator with XRE-family HTH domain
MDFSKKLKEQRMAHKLSQEQLADKLHVARQSISKWESGKAYPSIGGLIRLSELFNVSIDEFLKDDAHLKNSVVRDGEKTRYPRLQLFFGGIFMAGAAIIVIKIVAIILIKTDVINEDDVQFMRGWWASLLPLAMMLAGGIGVDELKKIKH